MSSMSLFSLQPLHCQICTKQFMHDFNLQGGYTDNAAVKNVMRFMKSEKPKLVWGNHMKNTKKQEKPMSNEAHDNLVVMLEFLNEFRIASQKITRKQFYSAIRKTSGGDAKYCRGGPWIDFQDAPLYFLTSRNPPAIPLIKAIEKHMKKKFFVSHRPKKMPSATSVIQQMLNSVSKHNYVIHSAQPVVLKPTMPEQVKNPIPDCWPNVNLIGAPKT